MKISFGKFVVATLAIIGAFYVITVVIINFVPEGVLFSTSRNFCTEDILAAQVSPNGRLHAKHIRRTCPDQTLEHILRIESTRMEPEHSSTGYIFFTAPKLESQKNEETLHPLRIWWESDSRLAVGYPHRLNFRSQELHGVDIQASPFTLEHLTQ